MPETLAEHSPIVLVVEDKARALQLRTTALAASGVTPIGVRSHDAAVREIRRAPAVDLVLTDIDLAGTPGDKSGVALARWVKQTYTDIPVAGYSAAFTDDEMGEDRQTFDYMWPKGRNVIDEIVRVCRQRALEHRALRASNAFDTHSLLRREHETVHGEHDLIRDLQLVGGERAPNDAVLIEAGYTLKLVETPQLEHPTIVWLQKVEGGVDAEVYGQPALYAHGATEGEAVAEVVELMRLYWKDVTGSDTEASGPALSLTNFLRDKLAEGDASK